MATIPVDNEEQDFSSWERLRDVINTNEQLRNKLEDLKSQFGEDRPTCINIQALTMAVKLEEKALRIDSLKRKIEGMQKLFIAKKRTLHEVCEKLEKKNSDFQKLCSKNEDLEAHSKTLEIRKQKAKRVIEILTRLSAFRKSMMIEELVDVFKIEIDGGPASKHQPQRDKFECKCVLIDTIRSIHLPHFNCIQNAGHSEHETVSAIGYFIQAINAINRILNYNMRYRVDPSLTVPTIFYPLDDRSIPLVSWKKKLDREKFFEGLILLGKNIAQLRNDCGIPTPVADKTLSVLVDWIRSFTGGKYVYMFERPIESVFSPACLFINYE